MDNLSVRENLQGHVSLEALDSLRRKAEGLSTAAENSQGPSSGFLLCSVFIPGKTSPYSQTSTLGSEIASEKLVVWGRTSTFLET